MTYKTGNPALPAGLFKKLPATKNRPMTLPGTVIKSIALVILCVCAGIFEWMVIERIGDHALMYAVYALFAGLAVAITTIIYNPIAPVSAPVYAIFEGITLAGLASANGGKVTTIVMQSFLLTGAIFIIMLILFLLRIIRPTKALFSVVLSATIGVVVVGTVFPVLDHIGLPAASPYDASLLGIGFSLVAIVVAAFNLLFDFAFIQTGIDKKAPKYMEWYAAFSLLVTLVWLYAELLRLLGKGKR